jgi:RimJ/RimL family protein N-acetyltransferase
MTDPNFHIETPRLYISYFQPEIDDHCDFLVEVYNSPEVLQASAGVSASIANRETARERIEGGVAEQLRTGFGRYLVSLKPLGVSKPNTPFSERLKRSNFTGFVGMNIRDRPAAFNAPDIGFAQLSQYFGKGYATEAALALLEYFEKEKGVKEVFGFCNPDNENSKNMLRRLGFEDRGERLVKGLGTGKDGKNAMVWAKKGMQDDLGKYGL